MPGSPPGIINSFGGDGLSLFETRPLEDILAAIVEGWNNTWRGIWANSDRVTTEVNYALQSVMFIGRNRLKLEY